MRNITERMFCVHSGCGGLCLRWNAISSSVRSEACSWLPEHHWKAIIVQSRRYTADRPPVLFHWIINHCLILLWPRPHRWGIKRWWPSSVCPSVCSVPDPKSRTEVPSKMKIGTKESHDTGDPWPYLEVEKSKVTSPNFSFEARPTAGGATWRINLQMSESLQVSKSTLIHCANKHTCIISSN